ncbi:hypothetical protein UlMin_000553 [Ulmus minor]
MENGSSNSQGPASGTRARKKRKLRPVEEVAASSASPLPKQVDRKTRNEDRKSSKDKQIVQEDDGSKQEKAPTSSDPLANESSKPCLPEKRVLELILDILQRRDTHEIFAEPVDPEEVEDYYEIIKEPMDFGTMRAKLHEGMYINLEKFEHDVSLITKNAMQFNSSGTIYFRQARAIQELANNVFQTLKTHPENFGSELIESRRRSGKKPQVDAGNSGRRTRPKVAPNVKSSSIIVNESSKSKPSPGGSSSTRRSSRVRHGFFSFATDIDATEHEVPAGDGDGSGLRYTELDRRWTYRPSMLSLNEDESNMSTTSSDEKQLKHQDIGYRESLMLFAKDLGPVVQKIAREKVLGLSSTRTSQLSMASANTSCRSSSLDTLVATPMSHHFPNQVPGIEKIDSEDVNKGQKAPTRSDMTIQSDQLRPNQSDDTRLCSYSLAQTRDFGSSLTWFKSSGNKSTTVISDKGKLDNGTRTLESALEQNTGVSSFYLAKSSMNMMSSGHMGGQDQVTAALGSNSGVSCSSEAGQALILDQLKPLTSSQFTFNLPYLRARLGQTSSLGQDRFLQ